MIRALTLSLVVLSASVFGTVVQNHLESEQEWEKVAGKPCVVRDGDERLWFETKPGEIHVLKC